jgi:hypothetical protein
MEEQDFFDDLRQMERWVERVKVGTILALGAGVLGLSSWYLFY